MQFDKKFIEEKCSQLIEQIEKLESRLETIKDVLKKVEYAIKFNNKLIEMFESKLGETKTLLNKFENQEEESEGEIIEKE